MSESALPLGPVGSEPVYRSPMTAANAVTGFRALLTVPFTMAVLSRNVLPAALLAAAFGLLDMADGWVARRRGTASALGRYLDSAVDRGFYLAFLASVWVAGRIPFGLSVYLACVMAIQTLMAVGYLARRRSSGLPKTAVGPLLGSALIVRAMVGPGTVATALDVALFTLATAGLWFYAAPALRLRGPSWDIVLDRLPSYARSNYDKKIRRSGTRSDRMLTAANGITLFRVLPGAAMVYALLAGRVWAAVGCGLAFVALDIADGYVAREFDQVTEVGKVLDVVLDKSAFVGLVGALALTHRLPAQACAVVAMRVAAIGLIALLLTVRSTALPRNTWSHLATMTAALCLLTHSGALLGLAVSANTFNVTHYWHRAYQMHLERSAR